MRQETIDLIERNNAEIAAAQCSRHALCLQGELLDTMEVIGFTQTMANVTKCLMSYPA